MLMTVEEAKTKWPVRGSKSGHSKGYIRLLCPDHPNAGKDGYVYEHIYVISLRLGRGLLRSETVHHLDGNPANNADANLLLCSHSYHRKLHRPATGGRRPRCKVCGVPISYASRTGLCVAHYWATYYNRSPTCKEPGCAERAGQRSGFCLKHIKDIHARKRYGGAAHVAH